MKRSPERSRAPTWGGGSVRYWYVGAALRCGDGNGIGHGRDRPKDSPLRELAPTWPRFSFAFVVLPVPVFWLRRCLRGGEVQLIRLMRAICLAKGCNLSG